MTGSKKKEEKKEAGQEEIVEEAPASEQATASKASKNPEPEDLTASTSAENSEESSEESTPAPAAPVAGGEGSEEQVKEREGEREGAEEKPVAVASEQGSAAPEAQLSEEGDSEEAEGEAEVEVLEPVEVEEVEEAPTVVEDGEAWEPKTLIGRQVKEGLITSIDELLDKGVAVLEPQIVDSLVNLETDLVLIGQSKGKFGGGQRRVFKQTQKKTREGNKPQFTAMAVVGDRDGHVGMGLGKAKETVPARDKAVRRAKMNIFKIRRGCGSWRCGCDGKHSIPFAVTGRCGSVRIKLMPAPKGKGLVAEKEVAKVLSLAGIQDVWSKSFGQTRNKINMIHALEDALRQLVKTKLNSPYNQRLKIYEGSTAASEEGGVGTVEES